MNKKIPNGSYCLFRPDEGGSRVGRIVLVERLDHDDSDFGGAYTLKEYHSIKVPHEGGWRHQSIVLSPCRMIHHLRKLNSMRMNLRV